MKNIINYCLGIYFIAIISLLPTNILAQEKEVKKILPIEFNIDLGLTILTGNTEHKDYNLDTSLLYNRNSYFKNKIKFSALTRKRNDVNKVNKYNLNNKTDYNLTENSHLFVELDFNQDSFSGYERRTTQNAGYEHYLWNTKRFVLNIGGALGYRQSRTDDKLRQASFIQKLYLDSKFEIMPNVIFLETANIEFGRDTNITKLETSLITKLSAVAYFKVNYVLEHFSYVPNNKKQTDTYTKVSIGFSF